MSLLHQTEFGFVALVIGRQEIDWCFKNFSLQLSKRSLKSLYNHLQKIDPSQGMFTPEEKTFEVFFNSCKLTLLFDYFEFLEVLELVEEGLAAWELQQILTDAQVLSSRDLIS